MGKTGGNMKNKTAVVLPVFVGIAILSLYLWYLRRIDYPVSWLLVAILVIVCMSVTCLLTYLFTRGRKS